MSFQETNTTKLRRILEATFATTPATGKWKEQRVTSQGFRHRKDTVVSNEIQPSRMTVDVMQVGVGAEGELNFELNFGELDEYFEGALTNEWGGGAIAGDDNIEVTGVDLSSTVTTNVFTRATGSFVTDGFVVGQWIRVHGFTASANNGWHKITAVAATTLTVAGSTLSTEASASGRTIRAWKGMLAVRWTNLTATVTTNVFTRAAGDFTTDGFQVGQWIHVEGFANSVNNGWHKVTAVGTTTITVSTNLATEAAGGGADGSRNLRGRMLRNGVSYKPSWSFEEEFPDISAFIVYSGCRLSTLNLNLTAKQIITGSAGFMGATGEEDSATSVVTGNFEASTWTPMNASNNVGAIFENGITLSTAIRSISLSINNNLRPIDKIGSLAPAEINHGTLSITGTVEVYFESLALYTKFINHTSTSLAFRVTDVDGNSYIITLPKIYFTEGDPNVGGINQDVMVSLPFTAVRDATTDCMIQIDAIPA
jgi:hypothetical protein